MRWRRSEALRASLRFSSRFWRNDPRQTTVKKNSTTPSEKKVMMRSLVSPSRPSPLSWPPAASAGAANARAAKQAVERVAVQALHRRANPTG